MERAGRPPRHWMYLNNINIHHHQHDDKREGRLVWLPLTVGHDGVEFVVVVLVLTVSLPVDGAGRTVAPAPVIPPAPEIFLSPLSTLLAALLPVVSVVGLDRAEV